MHKRTSRVGALLLPAGIASAVIGLSVLIAGLTCLGSTSPELPGLRSKIAQAKTAISARENERRVLRGQRAAQREALATARAEAEKLEQKVIPLRARSQRLIRQQQQADRDLERNEISMRRVVDATNERAAETRQRRLSEQKKQARVGRALALGRQVVGSLLDGEAQIGSCFLVDSARGPVFLTVAGRLRPGQETIGKMTAKTHRDVIQQVLVPLRVDHVDPAAGVAVLRIRRGGLRVDVPRLGREMPVSPGDAVYLVATVVAGQGGVMEHSAFAGTVTGVREGAGSALLQTDLPSNPGADGGPVLDADGVVMGMHVAQGDRLERTAFLIPAATLQAVIADFEHATGTGAGP